MVTHITFMQYSVLFCAGSKHLKFIAEMNEKWQDENEWKKNKNNKKKFKSLMYVAYNVELSIFQLNAHENSRKRP